MGSEPRWTERDALDALRGWRERSGGRWPTMRAWDKPDLFPRPSADWCFKRFGSWQAFHRVGGRRATRNRGGPPRLWPARRIIEAFLDWTFRYGRWPTANDWRLPGDHPSPTQVAIVFGTWHAGRVAAGFTGARKAHVARMGRML